MHNLIRYNKKKELVFKNKIQYKKHHNCLIIHLKIIIVKILIVKIVFKVFLVKLNQLFLYLDKNTQYFLTIKIVYNKYNI